MPNARLQRPTSRTVAARPLARTAIDTPIGTMIAAATARGLASLTPSDHDRDGASAAVHREAAAVLDRASAELAEYFAGERTAFTVPLDLAGTPFQLAVWRALLEIPFARTRTYAQIARVIGRPTAVRAVGLANGANRLAIVVPCHRVIGSDGRLTGYAGGLDRKRHLLEHEAAAAGSLVTVPATKPAPR